MSKKPKKPHHLAIERVGRELYGSWWIGELGTREWKVGKENGADHNATVRLPSSGKSATTIARACFRSRAAVEQYGQVSRWLGEQEIYTDFDFAKFDAWFRKKFPQAPASSTDLRLRAVRAELQKGQRPGRGGNISWKKFCDLVRDKCGQRCDDKTIKRDVATIHKT